METPVPLALRAVKRSWSVPRNWFLDLKGTPFAFVKLIAPLLCVLREKAPSASINPHFQMKTQVPLALCAVTRRWSLPSKDKRRQRLTELVSISTPKEWSVITLKKIQGVCEVLWQVAKLESGKDLGKSWVKADANCFCYDQHEVSTTFIRYATKCQSHRTILIIHYFWGT